VRRRRHRVRSWSKPERERPRERRPRASSEHCAGPARETRGDGVLQVEEHERPCCGGLVEAIRPIAWHEQRTAGAGQLTHEAAAVRADACRIQDDRATRCGRIASWWPASCIRTVGHQCWADATSCPSWLSWTSPGLKSSTRRLQPLLVLIGSPVVRAARGRGRSSAKMRSPERIPAHGLTEVLRRCRSGPPGVNRLPVVFARPPSPRCGGRKSQTRFKRQNGSS
jgi:hypothetical protein